MSEQRGALVFLMEQGYLLPFKVLIHTLREALTDNNLDLIMLTDDDVVEQDAFVQAVATKVIRITDEQVEILRSIDTSAIPPFHRHEKYGAYWFLKFLIFDDYGYDFHIYLDADMVCLSPAFRFDELSFGDKFAASPTVGKGALAIPTLPKGESLPDAERQEIVNRTRGIARRQYGADRSINSGVLHIPSGLIGREVVAGLVRDSAAQAFRLEQDVVQFYIASRVDVPFQSLPIWYNFPELPSISAGEELTRKQLLPRVKILHYNRSPKPWNAGRESTWLHKIWWTCHDDARAWIEEKSR